jgi:TetR/AcrR family transcriptional regulator
MYTSEDEMKTKRAGEQGNSEEKVLSAAYSEFALYGFDGARIDRIARMAKVNKAMIYYHFKSKEALYEKILSDMALRLLENLKTIISDDVEPLEQLKLIITRYIDYLDGVSNQFVRILLREVSSGGRYFRKIFLPTIVYPMHSKITSIIERALEKKEIRSVNPTYTLFQFVGSIIFFYSLKISLEGTELFEKTFTPNYKEDFRKNLIEIYQHGIEIQEKSR